MDAAFRTLGSFARTAWDGPFRVGELAPPISPGDALMTLFQTLWRAGVIALALAPLFWAVSSIHARLTRPPPPPTVAELKPSVALFSDKCEADYPMMVRIANGSRKTINGASLEIAARWPGRSTNLVTHLGRALNQDAIVHPGETAITCWTIPEMAAGVETEHLRQLEWTITVVAAQWADG